MADDQKDKNQQSQGQGKDQPQGQSQGQGKDDQKTAGSASKTDEQAKAQQESRTDAEAARKAGPVKLEHGEKSDALKADEEAMAEQVKDPSNMTPLQMRPENQDPALDEQGSRDTKVAAMEPGTGGAEDAPQGGTNAPA